MGPMATYLPKTKNPTKGSEGLRDGPRFLLKHFPIHLDHPRAHLETNPTRFDPTKNCLLWLLSIILTGTCPIPLGFGYDDGPKKYRIFLILVNNKDGPVRQIAVVMFFADNYRTINNQTAFVFYINSIHIRRRKLSMIWYLSIHFYQKKKTWASKMKIDINYQNLSNESLLFFSNFWSLFIFRFFLLKKVRNVTCVFFYRYI